MEQALYRKYRPRKIDEVVGQDHVTSTLKKALKSGRISHAYLFTGPKGVGKTSVARILAHEVNGLRYIDESTHLDIIEIDAASNRRIDEIRDLREKARILPALTPYKVYIIDEVHMLTREAFNALLKTLEEPPAHIIFILATTEGHKLPETITSRTQRFEFKPISTKSASQLLKQIAKSEKIKIDNGAIELLAEFGNGSFRDSISSLDQLSSYGKPIGQDDVRDLLGIPTVTEMNKLIEALHQSDASGVVDSLSRMREKGVDPSEVANSMAKEIRNQIINSGQNNGRTELLKQLLGVKISPQPYDYLEVILLEAALINVEDHKPPIANESSLKSTKIHKETDQIKEDGQVLKKVSKTPPKSFSLKDWEQVVETTKTKAASLYTALRLAQPSIAGNKLVLSFRFPLHQKKLAQAKNKNLVASIIEELTGSRVEIECLVEKLDAASKNQTEVIDEQPRPHISTISSVFGTAELIES